MLKAIILSAGQGQRLRPLTDDRPKGMVSIGGTTIIERQVSIFRKNGIQDIAVVKGFCADSIPDFGIRHYYNGEFASTNMVYSLFCAQDALSSGPVVVSYGDIIYSGDVLRALLASDRAISVVVDLDWKDYFARRFGNPYDDAESLVTNEHHAIKSIGQTKPNPRDIQAQYIGLIKFESPGLEAIRRLRDETAGNESLIGWGRPWNKAFMTDLLQELVRTGEDVYAVPIHGGWCEIDSLRDFEIAQHVVPRLLC